MSDRQKHIPTPPPPSDWDESAGFRANFLHRFTQAEDHAALSRLSAMLYEYALEFARHWPDDGASPTRAELRAAGADLAHLEGFLRSIAREKELSELSAEDQALADLAGRLAAKVARLAAEIAEVLR